MAMNRVPTLVVGIGGIGSQITSEISRLLGPEDRKYVGLVCLDTNVSDLNRLKEFDVKSIQISDDRLVKDFLKDHHEYERWFPVNKFLVNRGMLQGAGQVRTISRLAAIAAEKNGSFNVIRNEIDRIRQIRDNGSPGNMTVMIVGSITGGTGAGIFIQLPYFIRHAVKEMAGIETIVIRGMFIGPDITAREQPSPLNAKAVRVNAYACLKELNAFYLAQSEPDKDNLLEIEYYDKITKSERDRKAREALQSRPRLTSEDFFGADMTRIENDTKIIEGDSSSIPYDYLYLIESSSAEGSIGNASISSVIQQAAHMVFTLMFTPVQDNALSVEDNMVLGAMAHNGMNRYASAGLTRMIYPSDLVKEYVTLRSIKDLIGTEWLLIDRKYEDAVKQAQSLQRSDATVEIPTAEKEFPILFEEETRPGAGGKLGHLFKDAFLENPDDHSYYSRAKGYVGLIEDMVDDILQSDEVVTAASACDLEVNRMNNQDDARSAISAVETGLEEYERLARRLAVSARFRIANEMFPPSMDTMRMKKDSRVCIYNLLSGVHPVAARYLLYSLINELKDKISDLEGTLTLDYAAFDFDPKTEGTQGASEALDNFIMNKGLGGRHLKKNLKWLSIQLNQDSKKHKELITDYLQNSLILSTCQILVDRARGLAAIYENFFKTIGTRIKDNADRITVIENSYRDNPLGQKGIYCSKEAFRNIYAEYCQRGEVTIPEETKTAIFMEIFDILCVDFENAGRELTQVQKEHDAGVKARKLSTIFTTAIEDTIHTDVVKNASDIVDLNILQALSKQLTLETGLSERNSKEFDRELSAYIRSQISQAMFMASPMLAVDTSAKEENTESVYLALHPSCARQKNGQPDPGATMEDYIELNSPSLDGKRPTILMDEEFSPNEIVCFKTKYMFLIEKLTKYKYDSENARAYRERIHNLNTTPQGAEMAAQNKVVNPHLNRFWHEEAYLPDIDPVIRARNVMDRKKAFIYGLGLDLFRRSRDEDFGSRVVWNFLYNNRWITIFAKGNLIGNSYNDLYESLRFNGRVKELILENAARYMQQEKGYSDAEEIMDRMMDYYLIEDLTQISPEKKKVEKVFNSASVDTLFGSDDAGQAMDDGDNVDADENILDILLKMRPGMDKNEWLSLFTAVHEVLNDFLNYMLDDNRSRVRTAALAIVKQMYANSIPGRKQLAGEQLSTAETAVRAQIDILLNEIKNS